MVELESVSVFPPPGDDVVRGVEGDVPHGDGSAERDRACRAAEGGGIGRRIVPGGVTRAGVPVAQAIGPGAGAARDGGPISRTDVPNQIGRLQRLADLPEGEEDEQSEVMETTAEW